MAGVVARPSETPTKKVPKKFNEKLHAIDKKKNGKESSYLDYSSKKKDAIQPPPQVKIPGFVLDPNFMLPTDLLEAPAEDTYSNPEGVAMDELIAPETQSDNAESNSYVIYTGEGEIPLEAPDASSYAVLTLDELEDILLTAAESAPSVDMLPPQEQPEQSPSESSYSGYDNSQSSYVDYEKPAPGEGVPLLPPPAV